MATQESSVFRPDSAEEDTHPHACYGGLVFLTYTVFDEEVGDGVERIEAIPCRRCAEKGWTYGPGLRLDRTRRPALT